MATAPSERDRIPPQDPTPSLLEWQFSEPSRPIILVVTRHGQLAEPVMEYAVNVASRLQSKLLVAYVTSSSMQRRGEGGRGDVSATIRENIRELIAKADLRLVPVDYVLETGRLSTVISRLCHIVRRIEFVVVDQGIRLAEAAAGVPVPVFNVLYVNTGDQVAEQSVEAQGVTDTALSRLTKWTAMARWGEALAVTLGMGLGVVYRREIVAYASQGHGQLFATTLLALLLVATFWHLCRSGRSAPRGRKRTSMVCQSRRRPHRESRLGVEARPNMEREEE